MRTTRRAAAVAAVAVLAVLAGACGTPGGFAKGPDPTAASVNAETGPFATQTITVPRGNGFGGGTIHHPTETALGAYAAVAVMPGYNAAQETIRWYGPRVASQGFVVFTLDSVGLSDSQSARATQILNALNWLVASSPVAGRIDGTRLAAMGWSMGGGGSLEAATRNANIKAVVPLAPHHAIKDWRAVTQPTLIVGCEADAWAPPAEHAVPFYGSLGSAEKAYLEIDGANHDCVLATHPAKTAVARHVVSWLKRFLDGDARYSPFLCPGGAAEASQYRNTCPV